MDYNNAILKIRSVNYEVAQGIDSTNFDSVKASLYYLSDSEYISASDATYSSESTYYYKFNWLQLPAVKGTSVYIAASPTSKTLENNITVNGQNISIFNEDPQKGNYNFNIYDGINGTGAVNTVDSVNASNYDIPLKAVRYVTQTLTTTDKSQARNNIDAATIMVEGLKINNKGIDNLATNPSITLTPQDIGAIPSSNLIINNKTLDSNYTISLTASDISAAPALIANISNLKVNGTGISNFDTNPSITLPYDTVLDSNSSNPVQNFVLSNKFTEINSSITAANSSITAITPKIATITVASSAWDSGVSDVYTAFVALPTGISLTSNTRADMYPNAEVMTQMINDGIIGLYLENDNQQLKMKAVGQKPIANLTNIQVSFVETIT